MTPFITVELCALPVLLDGWRNHDKFLNWERFVGLQTAEVHLKLLFLYDVKRYVVGNDL